MRITHGIDLASLLVQKRNGIGYRSMGQIKIYGMSRLEDNTWLITLEYILFSDLCLINTMVIMVVLNIGS